MTNKQLSRLLGICAGVTKFSFTCESLLLDQLLIVGAVKLVSQLSCTAEVGVGRGASFIFDWGEVKYSKVKVNQNKSWSFYSPTFQHFGKNNRMKISRATYLASFFSKTEVTSFFYTKL